MNTSPGASSAPEAGRPRGVQAGRVRLPPNPGVSSQGPVSGGEAEGKPRASGLDVRASQAARGPVAGGREPSGRRQGSAGASPSRGVVPPHSRLATRPSPRASTFTNKPICLTRRGKSQTVVGNRSRRGKLLTSWLIPRTSQISDLPPPLRRGRLPWRRFDIP